MFTPSGLRTKEVLTLMGYLEVILWSTPQNVDVGDARDD